MTNTYGPSFVRYCSVAHFNVWVWLFIQYGEFFFHFERECLGKGISDRVSGTAGAVIEGEVSPLIKADVIHQDIANVILRLGRTHDCHEEGKVCEAHHLWAVSLFTLYRFPAALLLVVDYSQTWEIRRLPEIHARIVRSG